MRPWLSRRPRRERLLPYALRFLTAVALPPIATALLLWVFIILSLGIMAISPVGQYFIFSMLWVAGRAVLDIGMLFGLITCPFLFVLLRWRPSAAFALVMAILTLPIYGLADWLVTAPVEWRGAGVFPWMLVILVPGWSGAAAHLVAAGGQAQ